MKKSHRIQSFYEQMAQSMAELRGIMTAGASPTANGRLTARMIEVAEPSSNDEHLDQIARLHHSLGSPIS